MNWKMGLIDIVHNILLRVGTGVRMTIIVNVSINISCVVTGCMSQIGFNFCILLVQTVSGTDIYQFKIFLA